MKRYAIHAMEKRRLGIVVLFALVYGSISLVNHYLFRTYALDLGMLNHAMHQLSTFHMPVFMLSVNGSEMNFFGDHFSPIVFLYLPAYYLFGSYALLLVQIAAILAGGWGMYRLAKSAFQLEEAKAQMVMTYFYLVWGIYSALSFDVHNNVIAAMFFPWFFLAWFEGNRWKVLGWALLICLAKENMAIYLGFAIIGLLLLDKRKSWRSLIGFEGGLLLGIAVYFYVITAWVMPTWQHETSSNQLRLFAHWGSTVSEIVVNMLAHPVELVKLFFENTTGDPTFDGIKGETLLMLVFAGVGFWWRRWPLFLMLLPILAVKFLAADYALWGINVQYSIEFVPILALGFLYIVKDYSGRRSQWLAPVVLLATAFSTLFTLYSRQSKWYNPEQALFLSAKHYQTEYPMDKMHGYLNMVGEHSVLCALSPLTPHLAKRERIYMFPNVQDVEEIAVMKKGMSTYPISREEFDARVTALKQDSLHYRIAFEDEWFLLLKRIPSQD